VTAFDTRFDTRGEEEEKLAIELLKGAIDPNFVQYNQQLP
jgi:hypothetical protein